MIHVGMRAHRHSILGRCGVDHGATACGPERDFAIIPRRYEGDEVLVVVAKHVKRPGEDGGGGGGGGCGGDRDGDGNGCNTCDYWRLVLTISTINSTTIQDEH